MVADVPAQHCQQQDIHARARRENDAGDLHDKTEAGGELDFFRFIRIGIVCGCVGVRDVYRGGAG